MADADRVGMRPTLKAKAGKGPKSGVALAPSVTDFEGLRHLCLASSISNKVESGFAIPAWNWPSASFHIHRDTYREPILTAITTKPRKLCAATTLAA
jgi:hypothetical protein